MESIRCSGRPHDVGDCHQVIDLKHQAIKKPLCSQGLFHIWRKR